MNYLEGLTAAFGDHPPVLIVKVSSRTPQGLVLNENAILDYVSLDGLELTSEGQDELKRRLAPCSATLESTDEEPDWQFAVVELMGHKVLAGQTAWVRGMLHFREQAGSPIREIGRSAIHTHHRGLKAVDVKRCRQALSDTAYCREASTAVQQALYPDGDIADPALGMEVELKDSTTRYLVTACSESGVTLWPKTNEGGIRQVGRELWAQKVHTVHEEMPKAAASPEIEGPGTVAGAYRHTVVLTDGRILPEWEPRWDGPTVRLLSLPEGWPLGATLPELTREDLHALKAGAVEAAKPGAV